jgi:hypothetical protein
MLSEEIQKELIDLVNQICEEREENLKKEDLQEIAKEIIKNLDSVVERKIKTIILKYIKPIHDEIKKDLNLEWLESISDDEKEENLNADNS